MPTFSNLSNSFAAGDAAAQQVTDNFRKNQAINALTRMYGPIAGAPDDALKLQTHAYQEQMNPLQVENQQLTNVGASQTNAFNAQQNPQLIEGQRLQNEGQGFANEGRQTANAIANQKLIQDSMSTQSAQGARAHATLSASLANLRTSLDGVDDPVQRALIFDTEVQRLAPLLGVPAEELIQQLGPNKQAIVAQGSAAIPAIQNDIDGLISGSTSAKDRADLELTRQKLLTEQSNTQLRTAQSTKAQQALLGSPEELANKTQALDSSQGIIDNILGFTDAEGTEQTGLIAEARELATQVSDNPLIRRANALVPGTAEWQLAHKLDQIGKGFTVDRLQQIRKNGLTFGQLTEREFSRIEQSLVDFDMGRPIEGITRDLSFAERTYSKARERTMEQRTDLLARQQQVEALTASNSSVVPTGTVAPEQGSRQTTAQPSAVAIPIPGFSQPASTTHSSTGRELPTEPVSAYALAKRWTGATETDDTKALSAFFKKSGGQVLDPSQTPWCAAFVNAVLGEAGSQGTGSLSALSFRNWGEEAKIPTTGDIVVSTRGAPGSGKGHVGFYEGMVVKNGKQYVKVFAGNANDSVSTSLVPLDDVVSYRKPPKAGDIQRESQMAGNEQAADPSVAPQSTAENYQPSTGAPQQQAPQQQAPQQQAPAQVDPRALPQVKLLPMEQVLPLLPDTLKKYGL